MLLRSSVRKMVSSDDPVSSRYRYPCSSEAAYSLGQRTAGRNRGSPATRRAKVGQVGETRAAT